MMSRHWMVGLLGLGMLLVAGGAAADTLALRNGRQLSGAVVAESGGQIVFKTRMGTLAVSRAEVVSLVRDGTLPEEVDGDAARDAGNFSRAAQLYRAALAKVTHPSPAKSRLEQKLAELELSVTSSQRAEQQRLVETVRQLIAMKRYDEALAQGETLRAQRLSDAETSAVARLLAEAHFGKAQQLLDRMDLVGADRELAKAAESDVTFYRVHLVRGERLLASASTLKEGVEAILKGLQYGEREMSEPERIKYHYLAGNALYSLKQYKDAASHFVECVRDKDKYPAYADALDRAADCFVKMGEQTVLKNAQETIANLQRALELDPKRAQAWFLLGKLYRDLGQTDKAVEAFRKLVEVDPSFPYGRQFLALSLIDAKDYDSALTELNEEIKLRPDNYQAYVDRAGVQIQLGNLAEADKDLEIVTSKDPSRWEAFLMRARLASAREDYENAKQYLAQVLALKQDAIEAHILMGKILRAQKDFDGAKKWLTNVVEYLEKIPDLTYKYKTYLAEAQTQLAEIDLLQDSPRQAETRLLTALQHVPDYSQAIAKLGDVKKRLAADVEPAARKAFYREAEGYYKQAIDIDPKNPDHYLALGILYHKNLRDTKKAVENYRTYLQLGGKDKATVAKWIEECGGTVETSVLETTSSQTNAAK